MQIFFLVLLFAIGVLLIRAMRQPGTFVISRDVFIAAPPAAVFPYLQSMQGQLVWTPFNKDPEMTHKLGGAETGIGARYEWSGNRKVGAGSIEITGLRVNEEVTMRLTMRRPMQAVNTVVYTLEPLLGGRQTRMIWSMTGHVPFIGKVVNSLFDCSKMVAKDFDTGLANLKAKVEASISSGSK